MRPQYGDFFPFFEVLCYYLDDRVVGKFPKKDVLAPGLQAQPDQEKRRCVP